MSFDRELIKRKMAELAAKDIYVGTSSWKYTLCRARHKEYFQDEIPLAQKSNFAADKAASKRSTVGLEGIFASSKKAVGAGTKGGQRTRKGAAMC
jgi:hypothetical protein